MYKFTAVDENGDRQRGLVTIDDYQQALVYVRRNYGMVLQMERVGEVTTACRGYTDKQRTYFFKQLAAILQSGVTLSEGLEIIGSARDVELQRVVKEVAVGIANGLSLQGAMAQVPEFFTELCLTLVRVGEESGALATMCLELADYFDKKEQFKNYFAKILAYPLLVLGVGVCVFFLFLFVVLPNVGSMYNALKAPVGGSLAILLGLQSFLVRWWPLVLILLLVVVVGIYHWRGKLLSLLFRLPYLRELHAQAQELRFCKLLVLLLNGGIDFLGAINSASLVITEGKKYMQLQKLKNALAKGEDLGELLERDGSIFSPVVKGFMIVGARTGKLPALLQDAIRIQEEDFNRNMGKLQEYLPPILLLLVAFFIGFVVLSVMHPIFGLFEALPAYQ